MALPGVSLNLLNNQLGRQPASNAHVIVLVGCSTYGDELGLTFFSDSAGLQSDQGAGEVVEAAAYNLSISGGPVGVMTLPPTNAGGLSSVSHVGTGSGTLTVSAAPHLAISIACTTGGTLGTAEFTFAVGSLPVSAPVVSEVGWASTGYRVPGTYTTLVFTTGTYVTADTYAVSVLGAVTHPTGTGPAVPTQSSSPVDWYTPNIIITTGGALGTAQFTYSLDGTTANTSAPVLTSGAGTYALPNTGIVLTFSGTLTADDEYSFSSAGPSASNSDLTDAMTELETTYLSSDYSMTCVIGNLADASAWVTQCSTLETAAEALFSSGVYVRMINGAPTPGTITASGGATVVNTSSTDAALITARQSVSAPRVAACAGDELLTSALSGLSQRRNASWGVSGRASKVEASQNIGAVADGAVTGVTYLYRNEAVTPALDAVGFITMRSFPGSVSSGTGLPGFYITNGHTMDTVTSDYYPLTNARVIDLACRIAKAAALPFVNSKIPTTTRNGNVGVITEKKAQQIEAIVEGKLNTGLVSVQPAEAVAVSCTVNRVHNILADSALYMTVGVQPFGYAEQIFIDIGLVPDAGAAAA